MGRSCHAHSYMFSTSFQPSMLVFFLAVCAAAESLELRNNNLPKEDVLGRISWRTSGQKTTVRSPKSWKRHLSWHEHPEQRPIAKLRSQKLRADLLFPIRIKTSQVEMLRDWLSAIMWSNKIVGAGLALQSPFTTAKTASNFMRVFLSAH